METEQEVQKVEPTTETVIEQTVPVAEPAEGSAPEAKVSDAEAALASEALEQAPVGTVPLGVVHGLRAKGREKDQVILAKDQLIERLQTELNVRAKAPEQASPLEQYTVDNPEAEFGEVPATVHVAERKWQDEQAQGRVATQAVDQQQKRGVDSLRNAQKAISDFDDVVEMGRNYLTEGNKHDIRTSDDPAALLYKLSIRATLDSGTADAQTLREHLQSKLGKQTVKTVKTVPKPNEIEETEEVVEPDMDEPMSPQLAHTYAILGL